MLEPFRRGVVGLGTVAITAVMAAEGHAIGAAEGRPPPVAAPPGAKPVLVAIRATAKDADALRAQLAKTLPATRLAPGCRYAQGHASPADTAEMLMLQGWDSVEQQRAYVTWRETTGDLREFLALLAKPPVLETFELVDA